MQEYTRLEMHRVNYTRHNWHVLLHLHKVRSLSLLDKVKSTDIRQSLNIEPLLLRIERSELCWYGHVTRMSHERTRKLLMDALLSGQRPKGQPKTRWRNYVENLG